MNADNSVNDTEKPAKNDEGTMSLTDSFSRKTIWIIFVVAHTIATNVFSLLFYRFIGIDYLNFAVVGFFLLGWVMVIWQGWTPVPEKFDYILELLGKYVATLRPGLHIIFPFFKIMFVRAEAYLGTQLMPLYLDEREVGFGGGEVDFIDASAPVFARVFFKIVDSYKATYEIDDAFKGIEENLDSALRAYLGNYKLDDAVKLKIHFDMDKILNGILVKEDKEGNITEEKIKDSQQEESLVKIKTELDKWGIEIENIVVTDIVLSKAIKELRRKVLEAIKGEEAAPHEAARKVTLGHAEKTVLGLVGEGLGNKILNASKLGYIAPDTAAELIKKLTLFENIGDNAVIIESGDDSKAGNGAKFGAGFAKSGAGLVKPPDADSTENETAGSEVQK